MVEQPKVVATSGKETMRKEAVMAYFTVPLHRSWETEETRENLNIACLLINDLPVLDLPNTKQ
jgi:hypothetical protein